MSYREGHYFTLKNNPNSNKENSFQSIDFSEISLPKIKNIWRETLENGMHGICFSLYEDGQKPGDIITAEQVNRRIQILKPYTKWIRSFSCIEGNEFIPKNCTSKRNKNTRWSMARR
jgi:glucan 1,3-beta-glucosidase